MTQQEMEDLITFSSSLGFSRTKGIITINGILNKYIFASRNWSIEIIKRELLSWKAKK
jgi:hypothetical protein